MAFGRDNIRLINPTPVTSDETGVNLGRREADQPIDKLNLSKGALRLLESDQKIAGYDAKLKKIAIKLDALDAEEQKITEAEGLKNATERTFRLVEKKGEDGKAKVAVARSKEVKSELGEAPTPAEVPYESSLELRVGRLKRKIEALENLINEYTNRKDLNAVAQLEEELSIARKNLPRIEQGLPEIDMLSEYFPSE